ncbi:hypothetical protein [Noviherbaspirillum galbum]|uniref:Uncharacterized protein n=1 Tax=Noviherbaspirillum galbum TaxID=2709383 RepID=A0A6B3SK30_9BURK|nr:hypothetical protein [Noviherbaspirillum galbum]NEX61123.1 hypothetical protein [Noviherbaspirillum galbum]
MTLSIEQLDLRIKSSVLALSARRILEHITLGQLNPFPDIPADGDIDARLYVDVINMSGEVHLLTGMNLHQAVHERHAGMMRRLLDQLLPHVDTALVRDWLAGVAAMIGQHRAMPRPVEAPVFLPMPEDMQERQQEPREPGFGVRGLRSALASWLNGKAHDTASAGDWLRRLQSLEAEGLSADELAFSGIPDKLDARIQRREGDHETTASPAGNDRLSGQALAGQAQFDALRLSILPLRPAAHAGPDFVRVPANARIKRLKPKLKAGLRSLPQWTDRSLGYWIDLVEWDDLFGPTRGWMAFTQRGEAVTEPQCPSGLCDTLDEAMAFADRHARRKCAATPLADASKASKASKATKPSEAPDAAGGATDWIVALPFYAPCFLPSRLLARNALLRIRFDMREGPDGERVLLLQELDSEWARQAGQAGQGRRDPIALPPWLDEWLLLALKLVLLHAAARDVDVVAWLPGEVQARRHHPRETKRLLALHDAALPEQAARLLQPWGVARTPFHLPEPAHCYIDPVEDGYAVSDEDGASLGRFPDWDAARERVPVAASGRQAVHRAMHAIVLGDGLRQDLRVRGFFAWGTGIA